MRFKTVVSKCISGSTLLAEIILIFKPVLLLITECFTIWL